MINTLYTFVETVINQGTSEALNNIITQLNQTPGDKSKEYSCGDNVLYVLRRFISASLARDPKIKENSIKALAQIKLKVPNVATLNTVNFAQLFLNLTNPKDCKTKQDTNAFIQGKINVIKVLNEQFKSNEKILTHIVELTNQNQHFQQQLLETLFVLGQQNFSKLKLKITHANSLFLLKILQKKPLSEQDISVVLNSAMDQYPKQSTTLKYLGVFLDQLVDSPAQFFKKQYSQFLNISEQETQDGDLKKLYYLLDIQKYFLSNKEINTGNISKFLSVEMIIAWLEQLRVKNKHMRKLANSIVIHFEKNTKFCFEVLKFLHEKQMYLQNISVNHPFAQLYSQVDPIQFWQYIIELINKQESKQDQDLDEQKVLKKQEYYFQLEYITRERSANFSPDQIGKTFTLLIKAYQQSRKSQKLLNLIWNLFHHNNIENDLKKKNKKKIILDTKSPLILSKIKLNDLELQTQIQEIISKAIKFLRTKMKANKETQSKINITFFNFLTSLIIYCIVFPEQSDVCSEIQFISKDLQQFLAKQSLLSEGKDILTKKRKKSQDIQDPKKPIHVLVDVFISLLTKAPIFLRASINLVFEQMVPYLQTSDLDTLLDVIQKPDQQYIQQI